MKRVKFRIPTWEEGREFMKLIEGQYNAEIITIDADMRIENDAFRLSCHFDSREFSFMKLKIFDSAIESELLEYCMKYLK